MLKLGVSTAYCDGQLALSGNLSPQLGGTGTNDSAYMYMSPWAWSKQSWQTTKYWSTAGDFGFKFSHTRRSWDTIVVQPDKSFQTSPTRIPCGAHIRIYVAGAIYDSHSGNEYMVATMLDLDDPSKTVTFAVSENKAISWGTDALTVDRAVTIAQDTEGRHGSYHLGARWTNSIMGVLDTGGKLNTHYWSDWGVGFENHPDKATTIWTKMPVVTTSPANGGMDAETVSIDAR